MSNTVRMSLVAVLLVILAGATGLSACGGGEDADDVLNETFSGNKAVRSGKLELRLLFRGEGSRQASQPVSITLTGPFQSRGRRTLPQFDFDLALSAGSRSFRAGAVSTGDSGFLKFQGQVYQVPANVFASFKQGFERAQAQQGNRQDNTSFATFGVDPRNWLRDPENEGEEDVDGTETIHISAGVDVGRLLDDLNKILREAGRRGVPQAQQLPGQISEQQRRQVEDAIEDASFDLYTGKDDKILRRIVINLKFQVPQGQRQGTGGVSGGELEFELQLANLNQQQTVAAPQAARPFNELTRALRDTFGGLAGLGGAGGAGGTGAAPGGTGAAPGGTGAAPGGTPGAPGGDARAQQYLRCLQEARGDVAKAQRCASLLNSGG